MSERIGIISSLPSPERLVGALRDVGYDFSGAVADIVDNSIAAEATKIDIQVHWEGADSWVRITDNGTGMDGATLSEALRFGSERSYRPDDLGKFGLGLKTASLSQCRDITVASRTSAKVRRVQARRFDLDRVIRVNKWEIEDVPAALREDELVEPLANGPGTVVLWTRLDRVLAYRTPHGERAKRALLEMVERLEQHLAMVFHRFIEGDLGGRHRRAITITVNGNRIKPWNPFAPQEPATQHLPLVDIDIAQRGVSGVATFDPYVLPSKERFSSEAEFNRLSGPAKWNQQQGFYIYRADRMIQSGGWSRMRAPDEHTKLARAALNFYPDLDDAFGLNIAKMRVHLPTQLRERLKSPIEALLKEAKRAYNPRTNPRSGGNPRPPAHPTDSQNPADVVPATKPPPPASQDSNAEPTTETDPTSLDWPPRPLHPRPREALEKAADAVGERSALERIIEQLRSVNPEVSRDLGW